MILTMPPSYTQTWYETQAELLNKIEVRATEELLREAELGRSQGVSISQFGRTFLKDINGPLEAISNLNYLVGNQRRQSSGLVFEKNSKGCHPINQPRLT